MKLAEHNPEIIYIEEPKLEFAYGQASPHPKDGLYLFGPKGKSKRTKEIRIGVLGTAEGCQMFKQWAERLKNPIQVPPPQKSDKKNRLHLSNFLGLEETFGINFEPNEFSLYGISKEELDRASRIENLHEAVNQTVLLYKNRAKRHINNEERNIDLWVIVVPEFVFERCRPKSKRTGLELEIGAFHKKQKTKVDLPLFEGVIDNSSEDIFDDAPDFHRQIKAEFLQIGTSQIVRETTIASEKFLNKAGYQIRKTQDQATVAWNISTGIYYKTQENPPWKLYDIRPGVCYIGLVYKNLPNDPKGHACCAAQMFLSEGDGVVFRGANGPWRTNDYEYHLSSTAARDLIEKVLDTYITKHGCPPKELFIHGQTYFNNEEWAAFESAAPTETNVIGVRIRSTNGETKLFRNGDYPVLRGIAMVISPQSAYLWTNGYLPQLDTYIGPETPNPLLIDILRTKFAKPELKMVLTDIMGLTKINYNSCNFNDGLPVTVRFAKMVGEILTMGAAKNAQAQQFKYYL